MSKNTPAIAVAPENTKSPKTPNPWLPSFYRHPLFAGYDSLTPIFENQSWPTLEKLNNISKQRGIINTAGLPIQFSEQTAVKGQRDYEAQIHTTGLVPTRSQSWHDFFNACVWLTFPKLKAALNTIHCAQPEDSHRTAIADAATVFDESGAILIGPDPALAQWLKDHDWHQAFVAARGAWRSHRLLVVGHSVLEKTLNPYPGMIAKVAYLPSPPITTQALSEQSIAAYDQALARHWLEGEFERPRDFFPLPVLGVPGVDPANEIPDFYNNIDVFRPPSQK